jgi:hypothetical protein
MPHDVAQPENQIAAAAQRRIVALAAMSGAFPLTPP